MSRQQPADPSLHAPRPALRVGDFDAAIAHYVDWLGFHLDSEWREAPAQPAIGFLSRGRFVFMINEHPDAIGPASIHPDVDNLDSLVSEWNARRPGSVSIHTGPPCEFPEVVIEDLWGNRLSFEGKDEQVEEAHRQVVRERMRRYVAAELEAGRELPTPHALRDAVGPPIGVAMEVLNEQAGYGELFLKRQKAEQKDSNP